MGELSTMPRIFALADLHLSLDGEKPMDIFGEEWRDHASRMAEAWDDCVEDEDTVLLPGDISWARNLEEAEPDLRWIGSRPGRKHGSPIWSRSSVACGGRTIAGMRRATFRTRCTGR